MISLPEKIEKVILYLTKIPGVGHKTAFRYVMSIMKWNEFDRNEFVQSVAELKNVTTCIDCGTYSEGEKCSLCLSDDRRAAQTICVVEQFTDLMAIENSGRYRGQFHILGGVLNPLAGVGPDQLRMSSLVNRMKNIKECNLILAINPSVEGDATCSYIKDLMPSHIVVERIGFGVPIGGSLEYLDPMTITKALENKQVL